MPSNSRKIFLFALPVGRRKCLRYHAAPVERSLMSSRKASSSFQACGVVTGFQPESSKSALSAPAASPTRSFQSELKLYFVRSFPAEKSAAKVAGAPPRITKIRLTLNIIKSISQRFYVRCQRTCRNCERLERVGFFRVECRQVFK